MNDVVKLEYPDPAICLMVMEDRQSKNLFSIELMEGIRRAFKTIKENSQLKVVITTGHDNFFALGGSEEELIKLTTGEKKVSVDLDFFKLPLECEIPTIAATQGHTIGGGIPFACLFDFLIMSNESYYSTNFMKYGFTPGMGATYSVPKKFGQELGYEMLYTAEQYTGKELLKRNSSLLVYPRKEVVPKAIELAQKLCDKSLTSLKLLKRALAEHTRQALPSALKIESEMHAECFKSEEVKSRIQTEFGKNK